MGNVRVLQKAWSCSCTTPPIPAHSINIQQEECRLYRSTLMKQTFEKCRAFLKHKFTFFKQVIVERKTFFFKQGPAYPTTCQVWKRSSKIFLKLYTDQPPYLGRGRKWLLQALRILSFWTKPSIKAEIMPNSEIKPNSFCSHGISCSIRECPPLCLANPEGPELRLWAQDNKVSSPRP